MRRLLLLFYLLALTVYVRAIETDHLKYIGMPVGGICTGQVYLGGDGQLWHWDIFNVSRLYAGNEGGHRFYVNPQVQQKRFENGFALHVKYNGREYFRSLNKDGFSDITFEGEYPIGKVSYNDPTLPFSARLQAYSPFIPTDADNSGLPVTVLEYTVKNESNNEMDVTMNGWLQNMAGFLTKKEGQHINRIEKGEGYTRLVCESKGLDKDHVADWGNMCLTLLGNGQGAATAGELLSLPYYSGDTKVHKSEAACGQPLVGNVTGSTKLKAGEEKTFTYLISWYFPNVHLWNEAHRWKNIKNLRHYYSSKFNHATEVGDYVMNNEWLRTSTKDWNKTWYQSNLPKWFLDRTFLNVSTLATNVCVRFNDLTDDPDNEGRFYAMEGLYLGHGTCTHVFHYEQGMGRVFPHLTRQLREQIDLGLSYKKDGIIQYRSAEYSNYGQQDGRDYAIDGHAGTVMRIYREHTMAPDMTFLKNNWPKIKKSIRYMINHDKEKTGKADGILEGIQYNTLDRMWYGKIAWISGLYAASLKAGSAMANEVGDEKFAKECDKIARLAFKNISKELYNGEYFIQKLDPEHLDAPNTNIGCHIDQLLGQYWSTQVGLGDIVPNDQVKTALKSIMKYNYVEHYGNYLASADIPISRWYADEDEQGVIMCSFPKGGADKAPGKINNDWEKLVVGYFSEVWTGQEHQFAAALITEGLIDEAMKVEKAIHERYAAERRNPYNEVEYGNHYTRAMSSYAPFVSAGGFTYHGPQGLIGFSPKMNVPNFKSAFITANGWGSFEQTITEQKQACRFNMAFGTLSLKTIKLTLPENKKASQLIVTINGKTVKASHKVKNEECAISLDKTTLKADDKIKVEVIF
jgi:uncharacterized protein (DUF608 family)